MDEQKIKFLEDKRVYLRPIQQEDLDFFYTRALWDKEGRKLTGTQAVFTRKGVQRWFDRISDDDTRMDLIICLQKTDEPIGDVALLDIDPLNGKSTVRISIFNKEFWGKGYGTEALKLLISFGFNNLNMNRIGLDVFSFNERAINSYKKLGFQEEGRIREDLFYDGEYHDAVLMGLLKREFNQVY